MSEQGTIDVTDCKRCADLVESRSQIVNGVGPGDADLLFVGEAPGEQEDIEGEPFVGRSGEILDSVLAEYGLDRETVRITNAVKCRPPENRDPTATELANCRPHLEREVAGVDPAVIVTLGKVPSEHLLGRSVAVTNEAGSVESITIDGTAYRVLIGLHPAATLYDPSTRETFEAVIDEATELVAGLR
ncbi:uracil-DNA glycosylase [Halodesulfurarchaeum formicicum]|uniref:Type-4 uracil-DNA glycosylase n=1 Tax=Halodesulfurarchaeum formicicum TaxID=1873524 RepID=A0A1J1AE27_9EURY|nr:uracil-DNA glycosylase [Halodesulfurarchaeum formicicum]APE96396.1 DNA polymerase bacteriophage-type [Halodesulfurarchaeum formicicum]